MPQIAITSKGQDLSSDIDPRFGRAAYFILVNPDTMDWEVLENKQNLNLPQGAGIQAGKTVVESKANVLITGNCGPKAFKVLHSAGIRIAIGAKGRIKDAVVQFKNGELEYAKAANVEGHWM
ncbi:NifB/NifX family molybdenum-iron cluster-binding protein [Thermodesulfobacteriota bacterium]